MKAKPLIYIAAPLFNAGERDLNLAIKNALVQNADVYLPQVDGALLDDLVKNGVSPAHASRTVFDLDCDALKRCDALLIVLNGRSVDEGAAFELGAAWALGKICVAFKDDPRQLLASGDNPMVAQSVERTMKHLADVEEWGRSLAQSLMRG